MTMKQVNNGSVHAGLCIPENIRRGLAKDIVMGSDNFATTALIETIRGPLSDADLEVSEESLAYLEDMAEEIICGVPQEVLNRRADHAITCLPEESRDKLLTERLRSDENIRGGKPVIKGTRISVEFILDLRLKRGWSTEEILENYPGIAREDINACLAYQQRVTCASC